MSVNDLGRTYTVEQVAEYMQTCPDTIRRAARSKRIRGMRLGKSWRFTVAQVEAYKRSLEWARS